VTRHLTRASLLLLAAVWVLVRPLAAASPPDPTWIAGVYDDDDLDDAVLLVGSLVGVIDAPGPATRARMSAAVRSPSRAGHVQPPLAASASSTALPPHA
jgi:hypothetical protein